MAVGVSYDEIASDVQAELQSIKLRALAYSLAAGILAVFFSLIITRPLNKIITSTKRLAHGEYNLVLPVHEGGEIGELARSFKVMVEQIRERNRALQEEQGKIRQLNADLTRSATRSRSASANGQSSCSRPAAIWNRPATQPSKPAAPRRLSRPDEPRAARR